jgi:two-component system, NtrC family, response regulator HydG
VRVLVVDDHRNTRESIAIGLTHFGYESDVAESAATALSRLAERKYQWLICDVRMPGTDGVQLAVTARDRDAALGLVLMTAYDVSREERRTIDALQAVLVIKPVTAAALADLCATGVASRVHR